MTSLINDGPDPEPSAEVVDVPEAPAEPTVEAPTPDPDTFDRAYVEELRQEAAKYRTRAKAYDEAFDGYDDDTREAFLTFAKLQRAAANGDEDAIAQLEEWYADDDTDDEPESDFPQFKSKAEFDEYQRTIAREEAERLYAEREQHQGRIAAVSAVQQRARDEFGYDPSPDNPDYILFMKFVNLPEVMALDDPMKEGQRRYEAYWQEKVQSYITKKGAQADRTPASTPAGGAAQPDLSTLPWKEGMSEAEKHAAVRRSMTERFNASQAG